MNGMNSSLNIVHRLSHANNKHASSSLSSSSSTVPAITTTNSNFVSELSSQQQQQQQQQQHQLPHNNHHGMNNNNNNDHSNRKLNASINGSSSSKVWYKKRCCGGCCFLVRCCCCRSSHNSNSCRRSGACDCRFLNRFTTRKIIYLSPCLFLIVLLCVYTGQRILSSYYENMKWEHPPYHFLIRTCTPPNYYTYTDYYKRLAKNKTANISKPKICITTLTDETNKSFLNKILGWRNFDGIMALTWENKYQYAQRHNYYIYDESHVVNHTRGPSWFKIIAVLRLLQIEHCDWVFWMDADMVIMNSTIRLEDFLPYHPNNNNNNNDMATNLFQPHVQPNYDLLLSMDLRGSSAQSNSAGTTQLIPNGTHPYYSTSNTGIYNAGAWIIRNSEWSIQFLTTWWNMKSYVQPIGHSFSGDNHALKDLLRYNISNFNDHCLVPPRCTFNSFAKFIRSTSTSANTIGIPNPTVEQLLLERTNNEAYYHKTDFVAHVAGVDNKRDTIQMLLEMAQ